MFTASPCASEFSPLAPTIKTKTSRHMKYYIRTVTINIFPEVKINLKPSADKSGSRLTIIYNNIY